MATLISDPGDPRVADFAALRDRERPPGVFVAEGLLAVEQLLASAYPVRSVLVTPSRAGQFPGVPLLVAEQAVLNQIAGFDIHRGVLASADRLPLPSVASVLAGAGSLVAVLEGINDLENMGALFRNAAAFGVRAVLLSPDCCDPLYRRSVRVSLGHVLHVPFTPLEGTVGLAAVAAAGFMTVALTPAADAEPIDAFAASVGPDARLALLLGAEGPGLRPGTLAGADRRVRIPLAPGVDSLNVATAAAVAFHRLTTRA
ncbi:MAG TPA: RNA methyltransferase [Acidimicrobiales bacterium]|nr:RNA methyltransferase [Acidimicrobiales bacterium]